MADQRLEVLKQKYQSVFRMMEQQAIRLQNVHIENEKLLIRGEAPTQDAKNRVWDQIKLVDPKYADLTVDITVAESRAMTATMGGGRQEQAAGESYTVQAGDTLSKIAQRYYGDASQYTRIFEANRDQLQNPDRIQVGQKLVIPS